ncbi:DUF2155 domain-containing protein [Roseomonas marmotae]|nr:DUF2155 domain-containing protein [Roseomonas marmotae]
MKAALALLAALAFAAPLSTLAPRPALAQMDAGWDRKQEAELQALDKVTARITLLQARLNQPITFGTLRITVKACNARPPEEVPDAAAWLQVEDLRDTGNTAGRIVFQGWMFANAPGVAMLEHPVYDLRVLSCR